MPDLSLDFHQVLPAEELVTADPLHIPDKVMHDDASLRVSSFLAPSEDPCNEYCRHPPKSIRASLLWARPPVSSYHMPVNLVHMIEEVIDPKRTFQEKEVLHSLHSLCLLILTRPLSFLFSLIFVVYCTSYASISRWISSL